MQRLPTPRISVSACNVGADLAGVDGGVEQLSAYGHEAVEEIGVQRVEAGVVGLQRGGESVLGDEEVNEQVDPLPQRRERSSRCRPAGLGRLRRRPRPGDGRRRR